MLETVTRTADADQQVLNQVQQTAASGEAHVQGEFDHDRRCCAHACTVSQGSACLQRFQQQLQHATFGILL